MKTSDVKLSVVLGTRPQIVKSAPVIQAAMEKGVDVTLIHTGQHYDWEMSRTFFDEFRLQEPDVNLNVGSGPHGRQTGEMLIKLEEFLAGQLDTVILTPGDTNSALAAGLAAAKLHIPVAHLEAGARSWDDRMPEELNRRLLDHCSDILFTPTRTCTANLLREGIPSSRIEEVGDTMLDTLQASRKTMDESKAVETFGLDPQQYCVATSHRPENVDEPTKLRSLVGILQGLSPFKILLPLHPRTRERLDASGLTSLLTSSSHITVTPPLPYSDMLRLISDSRFVLTDSGGVQKECFWLKAPCVTIRETTEWVETVELGVNFLTGLDVEKTLEQCFKIIGSDDVKRRFQYVESPFGEGGASEKVVQSLLRLKGPV